MNSSLRKYYQRTTPNFILIYFYSIAPVAKGLLALAESNVVQSRSEKTLGFYELVAYNEEEHGDKLQCGALEDSIEEGKFYVGCISWIIYQARTFPSPINYFTLTYTAESNCTS